MSQSNNSLLDVRNMTIWRGDNLLLDDVSFTVDRGSVVQIQGTNGTGKTTLLRALIGLAEFDEGEVLWKGEPFHRARDAMHSGLIYLGHKPGISAGLTPRENLLALCPELSVDATKNIEQVLEELSIADRMDLPSAALSAGQQRRISLARLRLQSAELYVLDEPLTSLDVNGYEWVRAEIQRHASRGGAVVFTTHQPMSLEGVALKSVVLGES